MLNNFLNYSLWNTTTDRSSMYHEKILQLYLPLGAYICDRQKTHRQRVTGLELLNTNTMSKLHEVNKSDFCLL